MRRPFLLAATIYATLSFAQIPNGDFNQWTSDQPFGDPLEWITTNNFAASFGTAPTCERGEPGSDGMAFAKVVNRSGPNGTVLQGTIVSGSNGKYGFPFNTRPTTIGGRCQFALNQYDVAQVKVSLTKWDPVTNHSSTVGSGAVNFSGTNDQWQSFSTSITYNNSVDPDTAVIIVTAGASQLLVTDGSYFQVDELKFGFEGAGVDEIKGANELTVRPSLASDILEVNTTKPVRTIMAMDVSGRRVAHYTMAGLNTTLEVGGLAPGRYCLEVRFHDGTTARRTFFKD